jgi:hypothetical protein
MVAHQARNYPETIFMQAGVAQETASGATALAQLGAGGEDNFWIPSEAATDRFLKKKTLGFGSGEWGCLFFFVRRVAFVTCVRESEIDSLFVPRQVFLTRRS